MSEPTKVDTTDAIKALRKLWMRRGEAGAGLLAPNREPEPPKLTDSRLVRIGWYIPPRHGPRPDRPDGDTFENFRVHHPSQRVALEAAQAWVASVLAGDGGALALIGPSGTGKSHLLYAACRAINMAKVHCAAGGWYDLADLFRQAKFGHEEDVTEARLRKSRTLAANALCIDEIRPTSGTDYDTTELAGLMTRAYRERQGVFVTSNFSDDKLSDIISLAASSRLTQVKVVGPDLRKPENRTLRGAA